MGGKRPFLENLAMTSDRDCDDMRGNGETSGGSSGAVPHLSGNGNGHTMPVAAFQNIFEERSTI